jgi:hypothetical protein
LAFPRAPVPPYTPRVRRGSLLLVAALSTLSIAAPAGAQEKLSATGSVTGDLRIGSKLNVDVRITHTDGWQQIANLKVDLTLRDRTLEEVILDFQESSVAILGAGASVPIGQEGEQQGPFFKVDPSKVALSAQGDELHVTFPIGLVSDPSPGSRVTYSVAGLGGESLPARALTAPAERDKGLTWGTVSVAMLFALFIGAYLGNLVGTGRRRRPRGPSVYASVQRRLAEERSRQ